LSDQETVGTYGFYSIPVQGGPSKNITKGWIPTYKPDNIFLFPLGISVSPDSKTAVVVADFDTPGVFELYSTAILGVCGNGVVTPDEQCDDDNTNNGDGCSSTCTIEKGYTCVGEPSVCTYHSSSSNSTVSAASSFSSILFSPLLLWCN